MPSSDAITVEGIVSEVVSERICHVFLSNGHRVLGYLSGVKSGSEELVQVGTKVKLQMSLFDLSKGRIILKKA